MNVKTFSKAEKEALLDLLLAGMYSDAHVASEEDARIKKLLEEFHFDNDYRQELVLNAALTRVRQRAAQPDGLRTQLNTLVEAFSNPAHRQQACEALEELLGSDQQITQSEQNFLNMARTLLEQ